MKGYRAVYAIPLLLIALASQCGAPQTQRFEGTVEGSNPPELILSKRGERANSSADVRERTSEGFGPDEGSFPTADMDPTGERGTSELKELSRGEGGSAGSEQSEISEGNREDPLHYEARGGEGPEVEAGPPEGTPAGERGGGEKFSYHPVGVASIDSQMAKKLCQRIAAGLRKGMRPDVFAKVGDSHTVSNQFLRPFATKYYKLDKYTYLQPLIKYFSKRRVDSTGANSFNRKSLAATVGWSTDAPLRGSPNPLARELSALKPLYAFVLFGSNDAFKFPRGNIFQRNLEKIVGQILSNGTIPFLTTVPDVGPKYAHKRGIIAKFNSQIRQLAKKYQLPLIDLYSALQKLPGKGLSKDQLHLNSYRGWLGGYLIQPALQYGNNVRNKITLDSLHKVWKLNCPPNP